MSRRHRALLSTPREVEAAKDGRFHLTPPSRPRPLVLVDMDGPLADFEVAFHALCEREGWIITSTPETQTARFASDHIPDPEHRRAARDYIHHTAGWFRDLPVTPGAIAGLEALADVAEVFICTKPLETNPTGRDDKAAWLAEHFGEAWLQRLIITPDKSMVRGDILLDDAPRTEWLARAEWEPVIFAAPYNGQGSEWAVMRHWDWSQPVEDLIHPHHPGAPA